MAQQDRLFFLENRDELWLTVKQRIAEISHSTPPLLWVTSVTSPASEWARHGRLQDLIFISSLLERKAQLKRDILTEALQTDCQAEGFMEWWLAKKTQNSQCKRVVSVSLLEGAILGLWQASLSQHGVWVFKFFRGSSETQKHRMLIPNLDIAT